MLVSPPASANLSGSAFEGSDGNMVVNAAGHTDWATVSGVNTGIDQPSGSSDNSFGQGTKEDNSAVTVVSGSIPPNKNDLTRFYEASELGSNSHNYLYLAWQRLTNIGNANLDFEINQSKTTGFTGTFTGPITLNRTAGDLLINYDFGGSGTPTLGLNFWLTAAAGNTVAQCFSSNALPCWGKHQTLTGGTAEGAVNTVSITDPLNGNASLGAGLFGEAAIDLTAAGVFPAGTCEAFGSTFAKSRSSSSFTAEIKDFIAPVGVNISNCGTITIHKVTENGDSSFGYTTTGGLSPATFSLANGGTRTYTGVPIGSSSVTENLTAAQLSAGWTLKSLTCQSPTGSGTSVSVSGAKVSITMGGAGTVDCTYTNHINLNPTIATTLSATTVNIGDPVHDSSTLTGASSNAGGTVTYHAYAGANTCSGTDLLNSQVTVTSGVVPNSTTFTPSAAGSYSFQAVYSGDGNNNGATSVCSTEQLLVKANPSIGTTLSAASVDVGSTVHDSATLTGATGDAGGTVAYTAYTNSGCTLGARDAGTVTVTNAVVPDSNALTFNTAGTYYWQAVYTGDAKNNGATSTCTEEQLVVNPLQPSVSTAQNLIPNDAFTLSDGFSPTGSITFSLFAPADASCSGLPALTQTVTVNGNGTYATTNTTIKASIEGTWRWQSSYGGDANNLPVTSTCGTEQFTIANH
ncbi:MAG: hypothetical protein ACJ74U_17235 [Jatrophihabitantaceae bacterium]